MSSDPSSHGPGSPTSAGSAAPVSPPSSPGHRAHGAGPEPLARLAPLALGALGIVYGDIGTSPLYALRDCFSGEHGITPTPANVLGVLSLVFWSLIIVISVKYLGFVMRADNRGEGGILALLALVVQRGGREGSGARRMVLLTLGLFGAALLYGDGVITPAVSVLSAVEGLSVATPLFTPYVVPIALVILLALFLVQRKGTGGIGRVFGPLMVVWFTIIAVLGLHEMSGNLSVLQAVLPTHAVRFFVHNGWHGFLVLGAVFLVVTGGEALYADMGHFGYRPIRLAWFALVLPALLLNYFGQGALLLRDPSAATNPFFHLAPDWALYPLVALATAATVIASQALISGVFSLTRQAIQLGYWPRLEVVHTSAEEQGQIYLPGVNIALLLGVMLVVLGFRSSTALTAAYGIAVTATMAVTTCLAYVVARERWGMRRSVLVPLASVFLAVDLAFFGANFIKVAHGGWLPLTMGVILFTLMTTWKRGRELLGQKLRASSLGLRDLLESFGDNAPHRVPGTAIFMTGNPEIAPSAMLHNLKHNKVLHEQTLLLTISTEDVPHVPSAERVTVENLPMGMRRITARYGFMDDPSIPDILKRCREAGLPFNVMSTSFFLGRETLIVSRNPGMARWREAVFVWMSRNARSATAFFRIPPNRVVELGAQVEL
ncbi:potassium transporter Kup [Pyxidicoccus caerfyrddinensis]|uniref:potassium transporter Kup n=1 Tax=Pyxidicoccus caerfyrddinensis TaxID=2709663 RepID=UPI0013DD45D0|nr:potassium transporter Kup [Pyxidicoccus caerfyrddinensis]